MWRKTTRITRVDAGVVGGNTVLRELRGGAQVQLALGGLTGNKPQPFVGLESGSIATIRTDAGHNSAGTLLKLSHSSPRSS